MNRYLVTLARWETYSVPAENEQEAQAYAKDRWALEDSDPEMVDTTVVQRDEKKDKES
jgi:hypothetical protein